MSVGLTGREEATAAAAEGAAAAAAERKITNLTNFARISVTKEDQGSAD